MCLAYDVACLASVRPYRSWPSSSEPFRPGRRLRRVLALFWAFVERGLARAECEQRQGTSLAWLVALYRLRVDDAFGAPGERAAGDVQFPRVLEPPGGGHRWFAALVYDVVQDLECVEPNPVAHVTALFDELGLADAEDDALAYDLVVDGDAGFDDFGDYY